MTSVSFQSDKCKGCGLCAEACPKKIIKLSTDAINQKGFHPAEIIEPEKCISCAFCATMCPEVGIAVNK